MPPEDWHNSPRTLDAWLQRLETLHPKDIDLGLDRIRAVWSRLGHDFSATRIVTVAGTNGKGSTATLTAELLRAHGWTVGLYTSPHFLHFTERVVVNGQPVTEAAMVDALARVEQVRAEVSLTYFEFTTLAAFDLFARAGLQALVLEVGLGGRLDAVNILAADCAVVTTIGLDHTDWLGDTLAAIAREKAGIARAGKPLLVGADQVPEVFTVVAAEVGAQLRFVSVPTLTSAGSWHTTAELGLGQTPFSLPALPLPSANLALEVLAELGVTCDPERVRQVFAATRMPGRLQHIRWRETDIWLDVAHNPQAAAWVAGRLSMEAPRWTIILGMLGDKDANAVVQSLAILNPQWSLVSLDAGTRSQSAEALQQRSGLAATEVACYDSLTAALHDAAEAGHPVLVCGSFYTVAAALACLQTD